MAQALAGSDSTLGEEIVRRAQAWIGTPYVHQASCRGAGTDCLGLMRGLWRELYGEEPEAVPPYTADWAEGGVREYLLEAAERHLARLEISDAQPGDLLAFRMRDGGLAKHLGVLNVHPSGGSSLIHAYSGHGVVESPLTPTWRRRIAAAFRFVRRA